MLTHEYLVHSWTSYLDVFPIGLSLISRPKKCNTMHKRNLPFRTVKAGGKKTWRGWFHRFMIPTNIGTKTWTVSVWISVTHSPGPANICWVHCVLYSKQPMKSRRLSFLPVLVPPHVTIYCPLELNPPPQQQGIYCEWAKHMKGTEVDVWQNCRPSQNLLTCNSSSGLNAQRDCDQAVEPLYCLVIHYIHHYGMSILLTCLCGFAEQDPVWWNNWKHLKET